VIVPVTAKLAALAAQPVFASRPAPASGGQPVALVLFDGVLAMGMLTIDIRMLQKRAA
jgi:hypothetical protein